MSARLVKNLINRIRSTEISQNNEFDEKRSAQQWRACLRAFDCLTDGYRALGLRSARDRHLARTTD